MRTFAPRWSPTGWASSLCLVALLGFVLGAKVWYTPVPTFADSVAMIGLGTLTGIAFIFLIFFASMRYEVGNGLVILRCGFFAWKIPATQIRAMEERDLQISGFSASWRMPGFALFRVATKDMGMIRMCAASGGTKVLLLKTPNGKWGVTPEDVLAFTSAVEQERAIEKPKHLRSK